LYFVVLIPLLVLAFPKNSTVSEQDDPDYQPDANEDDSDDNELVVPPIPDKNDPDDEPEQVSPPSPVLPTCPRFRSNRLHLMPSPSVALLSRVFKATTPLMPGRSTSVSSP
jgi:hypothetical protein